MKNSLLLKHSLIIIILLLSGIAVAGLTIEYFTGRTNNNGILIEWKTGQEGNTTSFEIQRSVSNPDNFIYIATVNAQGTNSYYTYQDNSVDHNTNTQSNSVYYYRLKCLQSNGSYSYSNIITVMHSVSGIRSTWGSIKAIFR
ncbi:MAG: hypothetical protein OZ913_10145 [Ignavibacteriaceae bacterium]|jgi:hypothetical protein|nr:MAG: hypothetical protein EDM69_09935 [Chlorobiota bacterium]KXK04120.1 MAG: BNR/Asp-box repeat-containing protein [Chlorobi bacterium OLB4]MBV6397895.1 hypothetical protein [Ignavibacteria bacterium]MCC6886842.1 hypothetical protein [Ignavibacteriales bacterium]MCE7953966.1 hypothetical protein [Chlorobi bacterium CHB7]MEB2330642.1 hypothetical protein [Ignavibacteriaceae bacterium]OQY76738.1 MAG: hypothetical protein B6D43_08910 [Ignavibacteriales bacterium UTCHB1]RIK47700.1 MAG: hypoth